MIRSGIIGFLFVALALPQHARCFTPGKSRIKRCYDFLRAGQDIPNPRLTQNHIWQLREVGQIGEAEALQEELIQRMKISEIVDLKRARKFFRGNEVFIAIFEDQSRAVLKYQTRGNPEVAAFEMDRLLQLNIVPTSVERIFRGKKVSLQFFVDESLRRGWWKKRQLLKGMFESRFHVANEATYKVVILDYIMQNPDRNFSNWFLDRANRIIAIDNQMSFCGSVVPIYSAPARAYQWLRSLNEVPDEVVREKLNSYASSRDIEKLIIRKREFFEKIQRSECELTR